MKNLVEYINEMDFYYGGGSHDPQDNHVEYSEIMKSENPSDKDIKLEAQHILSYYNIEFIKRVIKYLAKNGNISNRVKKDDTRKRQQDIIDFCKDIVNKYKL